MGCFSCFSVLWDDGDPDDGPVWSSHRARKGGLGAMAAAMQDLLLQLQSPDHGVRSQAEAAYNASLQQQRDQTLGRLVEVLMLQTPDLIPARGLACILLRQALSTSEYVMDASVLSYVKQSLLSVMASEPEGSIRRKIFHCIGQVAAFLPAGQSWRELLHLVSQLIGSESASSSDRELGFSLLDRIAEYNADLLAPVVTQVQSAFARGLQDSELAVRIAALKATCSMVAEMRGAQEVAGFRGLIPAMVKTFSDSLNEQDEVVARDCMTALGLVTDEMPRFWKDSLDYIGPLLCLVVKTSSLECNTRVRAIELLSSLAERCPARMRKAPWVHNDLLPLLLSIMCITVNEDIQAWGMRPDDPESFADLQDYMNNDGSEEYDEEEVAEAGAMAIDRISTALGGKCVFPCLAPLLVQALQDQESWGNRRGALLTLALLAEGCKQEVAFQLPQLLSFLSQFIARDPHPRVRYALLSCFAQLADDLCEHLHEGDLVAQHVVPVITQSLGPENAAFPRIQAAAASCLTSLCQPDKCKPESLVPQLRPLLEHIFSLLASSPIFVREEAMTAVATLAQVVGEEFAPYYSSFIPLAKAALAESSAAKENGKEEEVGLLGMKALEAFALMGDAVGRDLFRADAHEVLHVVAGWHCRGAVSSDNVQEASYVMTTTAQIARALGSEFAPYMPTVLPAVLGAAAQSPDYSIRSIGEGDRQENGDDDDEEQEGIQTIGLSVRGKGEMELKINTWQMQLRDIACRTLLNYVNVLGTCLGPLVASVLPVALGITTTKVPGDTRLCGYGMLPRLLRSISRLAAKGQVPSSLPQEAMQRALHVLMTTLADEANLVDEGHEISPQYLCVAADTLAEIVKAARQSKDRCSWAVMELPMDALAPLFLLMQKVMLGTIQRRLHLQTLSSDEEGAPDEVTLQDRVEWEQDLLSSVQQILGWTFKSAGRAAIDAFKSAIVPLLGPLLQPANSLELRLMALCVMLDAIEYGGAAAVEFAPPVVPVVLQFLKVKDEDARQTAAFGVGVLAQYGGEALSATLGAEAVKDVIQLAMDTSQGTESIRDNAISSVLKLCRYRPMYFDAKRLVPVALMWLPLRYDLQEAHACHADLVSWLASGMAAGGGEHQALLVGDGGENIPRLVQILAALLDDQRTEDAKAMASGGWGADMEEEEDQMWECQLVSKETRMRLDELMPILRVQWPNEALRRACEGLSAHERAGMDMPTGAFVSRIMSK